MEALAFSSDRTVGEVATELKLSYMGVKAQCVLLEKEGYLAKRRNSRRQGRPEVLYALAPKAREIFPNGGQELSLSLLDHVARLHGKQTPLKLLYLHFQSMADRYAAAMTDDTVAGRASQLAELRCHDGYFTRFLPGPPAILRQGHDPLAELYRHFPEAIGYETEALAKALGSPLTRATGKGGETIFEIPAL